MSNQNDILVSVDHLKKYFPVKGLKGPGVRAVEDISLFIRRGETLGLVGESGCGKSVTSLSVMQLHDKKTVRYTGGEILFHGEDLLKKSENEMVSIRGSKISMIFQEPMTSLNPVFTIGQQLIEALLLHENMTKKEAKERAIEMLKLVKIPLAERRFDEYPHQLSGGQCQRVAIARALALQPDILCFDEPTSALDPELTGEVLRVLRNLADQNTTMIIVTHEMAFAKDVASQVIFMDEGYILEQGRPDQVFDNPKMERTKQFLSSYS